MNRRAPKLKRGFTLVESVIYLALLVVMAISLVHVMVSMSSYYKKVQIAGAVQSSAINAMDRIIREARSAQSVDTVGSLFNVSAGILSLNTTNANGSSTVIRFSLATTTQRIMLHEDGVSLGPLTSDNVAVTSLVFRQYSTSTASAIKVEMIIEGAGTSTFNISENFYGTAVVRGSY